MSDVIAARDAEHAARLCRIILRQVREYRGDVLLVSLHGDHVHVVHTCNYSNGSCRCKFYQGTEAAECLRRSPQVRPAVSRFSSRDWYNVLLYFSTGGRVLTFAKGRLALGIVCWTTISNANLIVGGAVRILQDGPQIVQAGRPFGEGTIGPLEACDPANRVDLPTGGGGTSATGSGRRARRAVRNSKRREDELHQKMEVLMRSRPTCPMINIVRTRGWLEDPVLMLMRDDDKMVKSLIDA